MNLQPIQLIHPTFYQLPNQSGWIAHACFWYHPDCRDQKQRQQSQAVRALLQWLQAQIKLYGELCELEFPYQLKSQASYFVCFSHSTNQVALILSQYHATIDIELRTISPDVFYRFFHQNEIHCLKDYPDALQPKLISHLWQLKECLAKLHQKPLITALSYDVSDHLPYAHQSIINNLPTTYQKQDFNYKIHINPQQNFTACINHLYSK